METTATIRRTNVGLVAASWALVIVTAALAHIAEYS
jgi:hypothetical protein